MACRGDYGEVQREGWNIVPGEWRMANGDSDIWPAQRQPTSERHVEEESWQAHDVLTRHLVPCVEGFNRIKSRFLEQSPNFANIRVEPTHLSLGVELNIPK